MSKGVNLPITDIIVFNYMYDLGAARDFCTAITVSSPEHKLMARNLDYGFQQYLADNSIHIKYTSQGKVVFEILGHAGFVGTHTALKISTDSSPHQFGITLNQRVKGGLHITLEQMFATKCFSSPSAIMQALKYCKGDIEEVVAYLTSINTCSPVYYTLIDQFGESYVMEKNRGSTSNLIRTPSAVDGVKLLVQTNHDRSIPDPDGRSTAATAKLTELVTSQKDVLPSDLWKILLESPNFNKLTLMTTVVDVAHAKVEYKVWSPVP